MTTSTGKRFRAVVELTWDIEDREVLPLYDGDAEIDYARRSFNLRVRPALEAICQSGTCAHYHVVHQPDIVGD